MKRINPLTKKEFKYGDKRKDGYIFYAYVKSLKLTLKGFYPELWKSPTAWKKHKINKKQGSLLPNPERKGKMILNPKTKKPYKIGEVNPVTRSYFDGYRTKYIQQNGYIPAVWKSFEGFHRKRVRTILFNRKKDYPKNFKIDLNYCLKIFPKNFLCPVLKFKMKWGGDINTSPSLDRINNKKGYTKDNVIWISYRANSIKCDADYQQIIKVGKWLKQKGY